MKSLIVTVIAVIALATITAPALAMPADNGPKTVVQADPGQPLQVEADAGTATIVYVLIALGAVTILGGAAYLGAHRVRAHIG
jgi:hypothetical protein